MSIKHYVAVCVLALCLAAPAGAAKKRATAGTGSGIVDVDVAVKVWKAKPGGKETTETMKRRVRKELQGMLSLGAEKLARSDARWKLLDYISALPWEKVPAKWQQWYLQTMPTPRLTDEQTKSFIGMLKKKMICQMTPKEVDAYVGWAQKEFPDLRARIMHIARKNIGQPYQIYLLGEFPYELYDTEPLYCLDRSDCVVFSEHTYAMALSSNWAEFFQTLQKIRYKNGEIGMLTRNHYTEADWNKNNSWLVTDVTKELGATTVSKYRERIDRASFFRKYGIGQDIKVQLFEDEYIPAEAVESAVGKLQDGDFVNIVRGKGNSAYVGHVGLVGHNDKGEATFIHSTQPRVKEQTVMSYVNDNVKKNAERRKKGGAEFLGMKFLRLRAEDLQKK